MSKPFDLVNLYARFAQERGTSINDPATAHAFIESARADLTKALGDQTLIHGHRAAAMFEALVLALGRFKLLKAEDTGRIYPSAFTAPDFRIVLESGEQWLVEVKNVYEPNPCRQRRRLMNPTYRAELDAYAKATKATLKLAVYWARWNIWTLVSPERLLDASGYVTVDMMEAYRFNELSALGDRMIGTRSPLMLRFIGDASKPGAIGSDGKTMFTIGAAEFYSDDRQIVRADEKEIAWIFVNYGDWAEQEPRHVITNGALQAIEFTWRPHHEEELEEQGFVMIGSLSGMFSRYYAAVTTAERAITQIEAKAPPDWFATLTAERQESDALPLWLFAQKPAAE